MKVIVADPCRRCFQRLPGLNIQCVEGRCHIGVRDLEIGRVGHDMTIQAGRQLKQSDIAAQTYVGNDLRHTPINSAVI